ncbi:hypothetical protein TRFO_06074 [Tritrichomonas foetus]|uniref:Uncharacterized protein n=1 Tax=Tritrichomonas foetus TaxID=1144522 RepID=A0A1J4K280_9EUKA|nr:hypothetical protein TRFO_06074 [Tritrichomonas foetus]|eukprot:OHT05074.1 hypothetical protein TRFO_06074 [Tritrichomonas foetus]
MIIEEKESSFNISDGILLEDDLEEPQIQQPTKIYTSVSSNSQQKENLEEEEKISIEKANVFFYNNSFSFNSNDISDIIFFFNQTKQESEKEKNENIFF